METRLRPAHLLSLAAVGATKSPRAAGDWLEEGTIEVKASMNLGCSVLPEG